MSVALRSIATLLLSGVAVLTLGGLVALCGAGSLLFGLLIVLCAGGICALNVDWERRSESKREASLKYLQSVQMHPGNQSLLGNAPIALDQTEQGHAWVLLFWVSMACVSALLYYGVFLMITSI